MHLMKNISRKKNLYHCFSGEKEMILKNLMAVEFWEYDQNMTSNKSVALGNSTKGKL